MTKKQDHYLLLGIARNATAEEIRRAYFDAARRLHPDKNIAAGETELFLGVQEAYDVLSTPKKRARYDATLPPEEPPRYSLKSDILFSRQNLQRLDEPQLIYALLDLSIPDGLEKPLAPVLNLCLVLDCSTSMQGNNMDVVKATAIQIVRNLKQQDIFSVVAFNDRAETIIPPSRSVEMKKLEARIYKLQPSGGTEIFSGLEAGYQQIIQNMNHAQVNHIILITDGRTYGDEEKCIRLAQSASENGIGISGLGIGVEWNDNLLDELTSRTGGSSIYVSRPQDIQHALLDKFAHLGKAYAEVTCLEFTVPEGIELRYVFRLQPEPGPLSIGSPIMVGPIVLGTDLKVLIEFLIQPEAVQDKTVTLLEGKIKATLTGVSSEVAVPICLTRPVVSNAIAEYLPAEIVDALSRLRLYRLQEQARLAATAGNYDQAAEHLTRLATHLLAQGERGLARTVLLEAENLQKKKVLSKQGGKEIKYGTRALVMYKQSEKKL